MKTHTEYQTEKKRLKVPKVEEFTISFTDGVSERLKVRNSWERDLAKSVPLFHFSLVTFEPEMFCDLNNTPAEVGVQLLLSLSHFQTTIATSL